MNDVAVIVSELSDPYNVPVSAVAFSPDGKYLATRSAYQIIHIWDWQERRIVHTLERGKGATDGLTSEPLQFSPDGRLLAACHSRAEGNVVVRVWRTDTWRILHDIVDDDRGFGCNAIAFSPDGKSLIRVMDRVPNAAGDNVVVDDTATWKKIWGMRTVPFYTYSLTLSEDGKFAALGGQITNPRAWPYSTPAPSFGSPPLPDTGLIALLNLEQRALSQTIQAAGTVNRGSPLVWSPNGVYLSLGAAGKLETFDAQSGKLLSEVVSGAGHRSLRYTPNGKYLIEGNSNDKKTGWGKIWSGQHRDLLQQISGNVRAIATSRDGRYLATGGDGKTVIWELK